MKLRFIVLIYFLGTSTLSAAQSLKPLSEYVTEGSPDAARVSYVMARCSALYMSFQIISENSNPELAKKYEAAGQASLYKFVETSEIASKEKNPSHIPPKDIATKAASTVKNISNMYKPLLEQSYAASGSYLSNPLIKGDLEVCQKVLSGK